MKFCISASTIMAGWFLAGIIPVQPVTGAEKTAPPVGFIAGIKGKGYIVRNKDTLMISGMDLLYPGDSFRLADGSTARITICGGKGYEIRGNAVLTIRGRDIALKRGKKHKTYPIDKKACAAALAVFRENEKKLPDMVSGERKGAVILRSKKKNQRLSAYVVRGRKSRSGIEIFADKVMPQKPVLVWTPVSGRASYRMSIKSGDDTLWSGTAPKNRCEYPADATPLAQGRTYDISVEAVNERGDVIAQGGGKVSLFTDDELDSMRRDEATIREMMPDDAPERHILLGKLYEAHGQFDGALSSYEKALALDRANAGLKERIALLKSILETE